MKILLMLMMMIPAVSLSKITLTPKNHILFQGVVNDKSVAKASEELLKLSFKTKPNATIYLVIDSGGGFIHSGLDFVQLLTTIPRNVECIALKAHSMAHHFLQACPGKRYITPNGLSMAHRAAGSFRGTFNKGQVEQQLKLWTGIVQSMEKVNAKRMKLSLEKYQSLAKGEYWCYGQSCVEDNFVDEMTNVTCSQDLLSKSNSQIRKGFFGGKFKVTKSACPVIRGYKVEKVR